MTDRVLNTHTTPAAPFLLDPHGGLWRLTRNDRDVRYQRAGGGEGWAWTLADLDGAVVPTREHVQLALYFKTTVTT